MEYSEHYFIHNFKVKPASEFDELIINQGTSIYEVIRIEQGIPLFLEDHLTRLFDSSEIAHLGIHESYCDFETLIEELIKRNKTDYGKIKLVIRFDKDNNQEKDFFIYFTPHYFPSKIEYQNGVKVGLCRAVRTNPNAKILNTEARKRANNTIVEEKLFEVLLMNNDGVITEGSRSNIFFIKDNTIITPPSHEVLNGITRRNILRICKKNKIHITEKEIHISELNQMDTMFLSGTSLKVLPVNCLESKKFNTQNALLRNLMHWYDELINDYIESKLFNSKNL